MNQVPIIVSNSPVSLERKQWGDFIHIYSLSFSFNQDKGGTDK